MSGSGAVASGLSDVDGSGHFSLVWNTFPRNLSSGLYSLLTCEQLVDVTLAADGHILRAHKLVLSVCSSYFRELFKGNTCKHPIVILKDVNHRDLSAMLQFMYQGEVNIKQEHIASFLKVAEALKIKGLTRTSDDDDEMDKDMTCAMPFSCTDRDQHQELKSSDDPQSFTEPSQSSKWPSDSCSGSCKVGHEDVAVELSRVTTRESSASEDLEMCDEKPLDCSSAPDECAKSTESKYKDYEPHATPVGDGVGNPMPGSESRRGDAERKNLIAAYPESLNFRQSNSTGCHDTATTTGEFIDPTKCISGGGGGGGGAGAASNATSKGRRTVKGLPSSSLSLETTLRVISELGPTIRVERGKVIRMYSCPWCLRHFTRKENLKLHVRYIHGPLESLTCKLCGNKYKNSNSLRVHSYLYHNAQRNKSGSSSSSSGSKPPAVGGSV
ncbi:hypothetical protein QAD02_010397 [Eretmocerus hayati]|uniref:Uncharacterized protein n=1 Tax=Eretmocerus hayati TaxID=131215 RepID=A0ACC2NEH2_9HYME|nr:hypothetical protein QAD02_010397 [Eretmocerus hayati]